MKKITKNKEESSDKKPKLFKRHRGGIELSKAEIKRIKAERKKLRKELKKLGLKSKEDFEVTASSQGLYFDHSRGIALFWWWLKNRGIWTLFGSMIAFLTVLYLFSIVSQMKGHFTINMSHEMFSNGFLLSETEDFASPTVQLQFEPVEDAPCISFASLPEDLDSHEGLHGSGKYFGVTFFLRNEGEDEVDYHYELALNSESKDVSKAIWVMLYEDGEMTFYAEPNSEGNAEVIPGYNVSNKGYPDPVLLNQVYDSNQFEYMGSRAGRSFYRIVPVNFKSDAIIEEKMRYDIAPGEIHKYTIVIWVEGDDPDCTDELMDGHLGLELNFQLIDEYKASQESDVWSQIKEQFDRLADSLRFWE